MAVVMLGVVKCQAGLMTQVQENLFLAILLQNTMEFPHRVAQPGNSNEGMLHQVIEHCEEGDLSIFSGISPRRSVYHPISDDDPIGPQTISQFEAGPFVKRTTQNYPGG